MTRTRRPRTATRARALGLLAAGGCAVALGACGGGSSTGPTTTSASGPALPEQKIPALDKADLAIGASANATAALVGNPHAVARARALIKPLTVANTLNVKPSNQVAGGLVANLSNELDAVAPGLTRGQGDNEHLRPKMVNRFLAVAGKDPTAVFEPRAARGVAALARMLGGKPADLRVTAPGVEPPETASQLVARDIQTARAYWPGLAKRLQALKSSLR